MRVVSLFSGIGGFDLGFERAGMEVVACVEKDSNCRKLLASKFPAAKILEDVCSVGADNLPKCDVLGGGWPCQDLSIAGKRAGLAGARSGLFYEFTRIAHELQPTFLVWENVPGLLNNDSGRDMLRVVHEFQRIGYCGAWRIFDAQYFGLAQRRRRVFGVFTREYFGAECCAEILSLSEGLRGHPAPCREAGKRIAPTISARTEGSGGLGTPQNGVGHGNPGDPMFTLQVSAVHGVAHSLSAEGSDASEDGTGRGTPIVPSIARCVATKEGTSLDWETTTMVAFSARDHGGDAGEIAPTLRSGNHDKTHMNGGTMPAVAFRTSGNCGVMEQGDKTAALNTATDPNQNILMQRMAVRRLTPRECERLQGFPDDWTAEFSDSMRYKMLGNAVAVPVAEWIGRRIVKQSYHLCAAQKS